MRGKKWLMSCTYLSDADKARVLAAVETAKRCVAAEDRRSVGVRPPAYIGEPHPIAAIDYGPGRRIYGYVYKETAA